MLQRGKLHILPEFIAHICVFLAVLQPGIRAFSLTASSFSHSRWLTAPVAAPISTQGQDSRRSASSALEANRHLEGETPFKTIEDLEALTVTRLKSELKLRGLKQTGKKADLVRLLASTPGVLLNTPSPEVLDRVSAGSAEALSLPPTAKKATKKKRGSLPPVEVEEVPRGSRRISFSSSGIGAFESEVFVMDDKLAANPNDSRGTPNQPPSSGALPREFPQLPPGTEDVELKNVIMDLLDRREASFELADDPVGGVLPWGDVYTVYTKKAVRPWDGPHADRAETHVVILLSDVFGWEDPFIRGAADHVADVCDAIVVVPDVFRKRPWVTGRPEEEYEAWRASHDPTVVAADIRACVTYAKAEYKPTSLGLVGFCYGGGRVLEEAAAGVIRPDVVVAFYPTRYDVEQVSSGITCPVAAFFAEHDVLVGARVEDAQRLREKLLNNPKVPDVQIKLCPGADHGFAHRPMTKDKEKAEDAMLLATSWLDMYLNKHFPAAAKEVKEDQFEFWELPTIGQQPELTQGGEGR